MENLLASIRISLDTPDGVAYHPPVFYFLTEIMMFFNLKSRNVHLPDQLQRYLVPVHPNTIDTIIRRPESV